MRPLLAYVRAGYDRRSAYALGLLGVGYLGVAVVFNRLIDLSRGMDWLLAGIWAFMTLTLAWGVDVRRDLRLAAVAFVGGLVIEWWGTTTSIWSYYTAERPPPWILPAWPVAALAIERLALVTERALPRRLPAAPLWWVAFPGFVAWMTWFAWPSVGTPSTYVVIGLMLAVLATATDRRRDLAILLAGALLGISLEYWGTSRWCWRYYTLEVPPPVAAVAHGFASVAFARGVWAAGVVWGRLAGRRTESAMDSRWGSASDPRRPSGIAAEPKGRR